MSRQQSTGQCLTEFLCTLVFALSMIGAPIFIPLGAVFLWSDCNHAVSAQVLSIRALPEYGRCQVKVTYESYDGIERYAQVETACPGITPGTKVLAGCYNHYHPDQLESMNENKTSNINHDAAIAIFTIGLAMLTFLILIFVGTCWFGIPWTWNPPRTRLQSQQPPDQESIAIGLPVTTIPISNPIISATHSTLKRANSV